jgi:hypothetical protein
MLGFKRLFLRKLIFTFEAYRNVPILRNGWSEPEKKLLVTNEKLTKFSFHESNEDNPVFAKS